MGNHSRERLVERFWKGAVGMTRETREVPARTRGTPSDESSSSAAAATPAQRRLRRPSSVDSKGHLAFSPITLRTTTYYYF